MAIFFCYILCNYDEDRSSNPVNYEGRNCTVLDKMAKIGISHQILSNYDTDCHQQFSFGRHMLAYGDYKTSISFAAAKGTSLW